MRNKNHWCGGKWCCNKRGHYGWWHVSTVKEPQSVPSLFSTKMMKQHESASVLGRNVCACVYACVRKCVYSIQVYDKQRKTVLAQTTRHCNVLQAERKTEIFFPNALFLLLSIPKTMHSFIYFSCSLWHKPSRCRKQFPLGGSWNGSWSLYSGLHITGQFVCF